MSTLHRNTLAKLRSNVSFIALLLALAFQILGLFPDGLRSSGNVALAQTSASKPEARKPTGDLVIGIEDMGSEQWLAYYGGIANMYIIGNTGDFLVLIKPGGYDYIPGLAESWKMSKDGLTWTWYLRRGVQHHDGWGEFTAEDVKFTLEKHAREGSKASRAAWLRSNVKSIEVADKHTAVMHLKQPASDILFVFSNRLGHVPMACKKYVETVGEEKANLHPIGTGPWKFVRHRPGDYIRFEAVNSHWRQVPSFKTLTLKVIPEESSRIAALRAGEIDITAISIAMKKEVEAAGFKIIRNPDAACYGVSFAGNILPTHKTYDPTLPWVDGTNPDRALKVRKALTLAINRKEIMEHLLMGEASPLLWPSLRPGDPWVDPTWKPYPFDPAGAKKLLAEAGYPNGFEIRLKYFPAAGRAEMPDIGKAVATYWEKIGMKVKQEPTDFHSAQTEITARRARYAFVMGWFYYDEPHMKGIYLEPGNVGNWGVETAEIGKLVAQARQEPDFEKRVKWNRELAKLFYEKYYYAPICSKHALWAVSRKVGKWPLMGGSTMYFYPEFITHAD